MVIHGFGTTSFETSQLDLAARGQRSDLLSIRFFANHAVCLWNHFTPARGKFELWTATTPMPGTHGLEDGMLDMNGYEDRR